MSNGLEQLPRDLKVSYLKAMARKEIKPKYFYGQIIITMPDGTTREGGEPIEDALKNIPCDVPIMLLPHNGREVSRPEQS